jgi:fermentation-respiration switch protein FrsA (DUF1100 family)
MKRLLVSAGRIAIAVIIGAAIANPALLYFQQEKLLFYPDTINEGNRRVIKERYRNVEEVTVSAADGTRLHGWFQRASAAGPAPLVIYFGGNAEDLSFLPAPSDRVKGWSMLAVNYRSYGLSEGTPGERALFTDALALYDTFTRRSEVDATRVAVMGRSLGSGVATYLAARRPVRAVVLVTPYDSVMNVAREKLWFAPVSLILKHPFDSLALAPRVDKPALFMVAEEDTTIPLPHSRRLYEAWAGPKRWHLVKRENHDSIEFDADYWRVIGDFLNGVSKAAGSRGDALIRD